MYEFGCSLCATYLLFYFLMQVNATNWCSQTPINQFANGCKVGNLSVIDNAGQEVIKKDTCNRSVYWSNIGSKPLQIKLQQFPSNARNVRE